MRIPTIALAMGDPAGIGPELAARVVGLPEVRAAMRLIVVGDKRVFDAGAATARVRCDCEVLRDGAAPPRGSVLPAFVDLAHLDPTHVEPGVASAAGGRFALANYTQALEMVLDEYADAVCFTPFNRKSMRLADAAYQDEIRFTSDTLGTFGAVNEFNIVDGLWNARVTSHVPMAQMPSLLTIEAILGALRLTHSTLRNAGFAPPRIAVAALNPHAGGEGAFGCEENEVIVPAIRAAQGKGIRAEGPFAADTVFVRAHRGDFDAVLTMYHDQGQIAMKLLGFDRGVTLLGGFPFPICAPAHGTADDIAGRGVANVGAMRAAVMLAAQMVQREDRDAGLGAGGSGLGSAGGVRASETAGERS